ncbi:Cof-type HAD-IIB family hydrolase [[Mycoplasma] anseris]|uniref:Cof-type HAD-IIB family hydrolase n=1 Tax=[Mycoplasma] anseris TaxID=92400 RepID=A0A2Z4NCW8_9BACT|nr:Cof-type HAD-IIB family hydrolase [[Mycoplasma] anseris]AWX69400.1 Cof-type HAD-IIB family hydrolase [[Mycoplasma] anseris]
MKLNFQPKAYFIDLDGTTLDCPKTEARISEENINAIRTLNDKNIPVVIATGRSNSPFVMDLAKKFNSPFVICQNGGIIVNQHNNVLKTNEMQKDTVLEIIEILKEEKMCFIINSGDTIYGPTTKIKMIRPWAKKMNTYTYEEIPQITNSTKILTFGKNKKGILKLRDRLAKKFINISQHVVSRGYSIEINDENATKGIADRFVCQLLNINPNQAVHVGDSGNDTTSINHIGAFICMKNGLKNIRRQAHLIGPHYKKAGIAKLFKELNSI